MVTQGLAAGEKYGKLKKNISILLLNFTRSQKSEQFHACFMLKELITEVFEIRTGTWERGLCGRVEATGWKGISLKD